MTIELTQDEYDVIRFYLCRASMKTLCRKFEERDRNNEGMEEYFNDQHNTIREVISKMDEARFPNN